jgi:multiple sugar transport system substrate-binding protein
MKKTFIFVFITIMLFMTAACSSGSQNDNLTKTSSEPDTTAQSDNSSNTDSTKPVELSVVFPSFTAVKDRLDESLAEFNKTYPNIKVKSTFVTAKAWSDFFTKIQTMVAGGDPPDITRITNEGAQMFAKKNLALPLNDLIAVNKEFIQEVGADDVHPNLAAPYQVDGNTFAYAWEWNNLIVHFNTDLLKQAGLPLPSKDWTKEDFLKYAQALTTEKDGKKTYGVFVPNFYFAMSAWLFNNEASVMNADMTESTLTDPKAVEVFQFFHDLIYKYKVAPAPAPNSDTTQMMMNGQIGMFFAGRWPVTTYKNSNFTAFDVQALPKLRTQKTIYGGGAFIVNKTSKHPKEAFLLSTWLNASEYSQKNLLSGDAIPSRKKVMNDILPNNPPANYKLFMDADEVKPVEAPPQYPAIAQTLEKYMSSIFADETPVEEALAAAKKEIDNILKND